MKTTLTTLFVALLCCATTLSAQTFGVRLGFNSTNVNVDFDDVDVDTKGQGNLMLGAFVNLPIGANLLSIQPELNYLNRGFSFEESDFVDATEFTAAYLELGTLLRLNFNQEGPLGFYVGAGPTFSYALNGTIEALGQEVDIDFDDDGINRTTLLGTLAAGVNFGGVDGLGFFGEVRYQTAFGDFFDDDEFLEGSSKSSLIGLNAGIRVPLGN